MNPFTPPRFLVVIMMTGVLGCSGSAAPSTQPRESTESDSARRGALSRSEGEGPRPRRVDSGPSSVAAQSESTSANTLTKASPPPLGATSYKVVGVVRKLNRGAGLVTIRHEAIPGFMPAMTMPFHVDDRELLEDLQVGDKVEGRLLIEGERSELVDLAITELAPPPELTVDLSGGQPTLRPTVRLLQPGEEVPDFSMTTQDGKPLALSDLRGKLVVLTFIYTRCPLPDFCPLMDRKYAEIAGRLKGLPGGTEAVRLLSVSFDPEHDTPEILRKHAAIHGASPPLWTFAVASHEELRRVAEPLGLSYGPTANEIIHTLSTAVIDRNGRLIQLEQGNGWQVDDVVKTLYSRIRSRPR